MPTEFDEDGFLARFLAEKGRELAAAEPSHLWKPGRQVGEWRITAFLARGGSSEAYCARHIRLGTPAVLKVLWRDEEAPRARFARETAFLMGAPDPAFPAFYGTGEEDGRPWMAMESLGEAPLPEKDAEAAEYLADVAHGVAVLHARGWVHRDLKPRNILVREADGHAVLIDFGLLKPVEEGEKEVASGSGLSVVEGHAVGVGTPGFAAPEQFAGGETTPAADVYALGMLAEACFGGKPPRAWNRIIRRATAALPRQRYRDAAAFLNAVKTRHRRRNFAVAAFTVATLAALAAAGLWFWNASQAEKPLAAGTERTFVLPGGEPMAMVWCPPGTFTMGSPETEEKRRKDETPHRVTLTEGFWMAKYEVTQKQWRSVMGTNPSRVEGRDECPMAHLKWSDAQSFCKRAKLSLPTEAEWEYACRAGTTGPYAGNLDDMGWYALNSGGGYHQVGMKAPNAWGLHDMHGNLCEWCQDGYDSEWYEKSPATDPFLASGPFGQKVARGGSCDSHPASCRSAFRNPYRVERFDGESSREFHSGDWLKYAVTGFRPVFRGADPSTPPSRKGKNSGKGKTSGK
jgi:formylglycine-generating enzyme required for sulfatase activity